MLRIAWGALGRRGADWGVPLAAGAAVFFLAGTARSLPRLVTSDGGSLPARRAARASRAAACAGAPEEGAASRPSARVAPCDEDCCSASSADARHSLRSGVARPWLPGDASAANGVAGAGEAAPRFASDAAVDRADRSPRDTAADAPSASGAPLLPLARRPPVDVDDVARRPPKLMSPRTDMDEKAGEKAGEFRRALRPEPSRGVRRPVDGGSVDGVAVSVDAVAGASLSRVRAWCGVSGNADMSLVVHAANVVWTSSNRGTESSFKEQGIQVSCTVQARSREGCGVDLGSQQEMRCAV